MINKTILISVLLKALRICKNIESLSLTQPGLSDIKTLYYRYMLRLVMRALS
jgi:hypothetical protein